MCYLGPGEAFTIAFYVSTNNELYTPKDAVNYAGLRFFDYGGAGIVSSNAKVSLSRYYSDGINENNGDCLVCNNDDAIARGFSGGDSNTNWLLSNVSLRRGEVIPGIREYVEKVVDSAGNLVSENSSTAHYSDTVVWGTQLYNDGDAIITDYTFTTVVQNPFRFKDSVTMKYYYYGDKVREFSIMNFDEWSSDGSQVTVSTTGNDSQETITVGDMNWTQLNYTSANNSINPSFDFEVRLYREQDTNNMVMDIRFKDKRNSVPEHGSVVLLTCSQIPLGETVNNKVYSNRSYFTLNKQTYDVNNVFRGENTLYSGISENQPSVTNIARIQISFGNYTTSLISISDSNSQTANSLSEKNYIVLPQNQSSVSYTLSVTTKNEPIENIVMIDNLPEPGDHEPFNASEDRSSEFKMKFCDPAGFVVKIAKQDETENTLSLNSSDYEYKLQFSDKTSFNDADWNGTNSSDWYNQPTADSRSFRVVIKDTSTDQLGNLMPAKSTISVKFNAQADGVIEDSLVAWNSFGYHFNTVGQNTAQDSAPLKVGLKTKSRPMIKKTLKDDMGNEWNAENDLSFGFIVYSGTAIEGLSELSDEADIAETLSGTDYTYINLTVDRGESSSQSRKVDLVTYNYLNNAWQATETPFVFVNQNKYTVFELPAAGSDYSFGNFNGTARNSYTFEYNEENVQSITAVNIRALWKLNVLKTDECDVPLSNAVIGLYSKNAADKLSDSRFNSLIQSLDLSGQENLSDTIVYNGEIYYIKAIEQTRDSGIVSWTSLSESEYLVKELKAPQGYMIDENVHLCCGAYDAPVGLQIVDPLERYELPEMGGKKRKVDLFGSMLTGAALTLLFASLRKKKRGVH